MKLILATLLILSITITANTIPLQDNVNNPENSINTLDKRYRYSGSQKHEASQKREAEPYRNSASQKRDAAPHKLPAPL